MQSLEDVSARLGPIPASVHLEYSEAMQHANAVRSYAQKVAQASWNLDMALRDVRNGGSIFRVNAALDNARALINQGF